MSRLVKFALSALGWGVGMAWLTAMLWLASVSPRMPDPAYGRIFPWRYKGTYLYLTYREHLLTSEWFGVAFPVTILAGSLLARERRKTNPPGPQPPPQLWWPGKL
jgi:hypothetical protein